MNSNNSLLQKILVGFASAALLAMGAGYIQHEAMLTGVERDISYIRENITEIRDLLLTKR